MFHKLRMRLVLTNVVTSGLIVVLIAVIAYVMIASSISKQSQQVLQMISVDVGTQINGGGINPDVTAKMMGGLYPYFVVQVNNNGQSIQTNFKTGIDNEKLLLMARSILAAETNKKKQLNSISSDIQKKKASAVLSTFGTVIDVGSRSFRYSDVGARNGITYLVFLDMEQERSLMGKILFSLVMCVLAGLAMVFFGGLFMAGRAIRPIHVSWQRQRDFLADASHELRSPLAAIRSSLDVVLAKPEATIAEKQTFLEGVSEEVSRMSRLVDDMLLIARADSDTVIFENENVNIANVVQSAVNLIKPEAQKKLLGCTLEIQATPLVRGDAGRLKQVVLILLDNAIKFTPEGGKVNVHVKYNSGRAVVEVADTGIGIGMEHLQLIFERFYRVDKARSRESGGQGLGLSIAKWIVEKHSGNIAVASESGKGSVFTITLPEA